MMMSWIISIIGIVVTILFVVGTHEAGHFVMARLVGVKVLRFSIGFGKKIVGWRDCSGTEYVIAMIPLGGYVKMLDENEAPVASKEKPFSYNVQPFYKKFLIILAGPLVNFLCAFCLYWLLFSIGFTAIRPIVDQVTPHSIADSSGIKQDSEIIAINDRPVISWTGVLFQFFTAIGDAKPMIVTVSHDDSTKNITLDLSSVEIDGLNPDPLKAVGIIPYAPKPPLITWPKDKLKEVDYSFLSAATPAMNQVVNLTYFNLILFGKMITGKLSLQSLGGPITIFSAAGTSFHNGFIPYIGFLAFLSLSIGIINIFPIPGLDGGHLLIQLIEAIIQRPLPEKMVNWLFRLGFAFIIFIFFQAFINDILRLW